MTAYETTESGLSFLIKTILGYQAPGYFLFFAAGLLVAAAIFGGKQFRIVFLWPFVILCATVFNPYLFPLLFERWPELIEEYYRFLWLIPAFLLIGGGFALIAFKFRSKAAKFLLILTFAAGILLLAVPSLRSYREIPLPANSLKADPELITLCDYIAGESETDTPVIAFEREDFAKEAVAYNPSIRISSALYSPGGAGNLKNDGVNFCVIAKSRPAMEEKLQSLGYRAIAHTPENMIFAQFFTGN